MFWLWHSQIFLCSCLSSEFFEYQIKKFLLTFSLIKCVSKNVIFFIRTAKKKPIFFPYHPVTLISFHEFPIANVWEVLLTKKCTLSIDAKNSPKRYIYYIGAANRLLSIKAKIWRCGHIATQGALSSIFWSLLKTTDW